VHYVADLMAALTWNERTSRRMQRELAEAWGVAPSTIRNYSAEANRAIQDAIIERRGPVAQRAIDRIEKIGGMDIMQAKFVPGLAGAIVHANEVLLKMTGYSEPDEDKFRPSTLAVVGQIVTSPVFTGLLNGGAKQHANGKEETGRPALDGRTEDADAVPSSRRH
jgi:hypothetical protein